MKVRAKIVSETSMAIALEDKKGRIVYVSRDAILETGDNWVEIKKETLEMLDKNGYEFPAYREKKEKKSKEEKNKEGGEG